MTSTWFFLSSGPGSASWNMALDEALLEQCSQIGGPVLRFYGWTEPAASFGYSQSYEEISRLTPLRPLVRRPTGGGLVPHDIDWTYSLAVPPQHAWYELSAVESYRRMHEWVCAAFARLGQPMELAPCCRKDVPGQCFIGYEKFDVLWHGRKVAGAAQRRPRHGLLIQGSVQPPPLPEPMPRGAWESAMVQEGNAIFLGDGEPLVAQEGLLDRARELEREKYGRSDYNSKR